MQHFPAQKENDNRMWVFFFLFEFDATVRPARPALLPPTELHFADNERNKLGYHCSNGWPLFRISNITEASTSPVTLEILILKHISAVNLASDFFNYPVNLNILMKNTRCFVHCEDWRHACPCIAMLSNCVFFSFCLVACMFQSCSDAHLMQ